MNETRTETRTIEVTPEFYAQLLDYLKPVERWNVDGGGVAMYVIPSTCLIFKPVTPNE